MPCWVASAADTSRLAALDLLRMLLTVVGGGSDAHCQLLRHFAVCLSGGYEERLVLHPSAYAFRMPRGDSNPLRERLPEGECMA